MRIIVRMNMKEFEFNYFSLCFVAQDCPEEETCSIIWIPSRVLWVPYGLKSELVWTKTSIGNKK